MKTSKVLVLAAVFSFAVASAWMTGAQAGDQKGTTTAPPPATTTQGKQTTKKTYNSGQSTTGYTKASPCCDYGGTPLNWGPGLQQGGGKSGK
jgi:hypothetical protein